MWGKLAREMLTCLLGAGSPEKKLRSRRSISGTNTPLSSPSPQGSIRSAPVSRASIRQGLGRRLKLQFPLFDDQRDVDKDVLVDYDAYMRKRLSTAASGSLLHASRDSSGGWLPLRYLSEDEPNTLVEEDVNTDAVLYEHTDYVPHLQRYCAQPGSYLPPWLPSCSLSRARALSPPPPLAKALGSCVHVCMCVCARVHACIHACLRARTCVNVCVRAYSGIFARKVWTVTYV
jgi:hypothetical protein